jgi:small-conductance mechanosensitive channel
MTMDDFTNSEIEPEGMWANSRIARVLREVSDLYDRAAQTSRTTSLIARTRAIAKASRLYRWCVTPPEHRVIRIDVGDSRLLGPIVGMAIAMWVRVRTIWQSSRSALAFRTLREWTRNAPIRKVAVFLLILVAGSLAASVQRPTPIGSIQLAILAGLGLLGLREGRSLEELLNSRVGRVLRAPFTSSEESQR